jgi:ribonucleoside-diphosphate reductase beta chain
VTEATASELAHVDNSDLADMTSIDIDHVLSYVHRDLKSLPDYPALYRRYLRQRWDVYALNFDTDIRQWHECMTDGQRAAFLAVASGLHHGERQVEAELPAFMLGSDDEHNVFLASQLEDEARHMVFFDRFYREVVGTSGSSILAVLDASYPHISETFVGPFGLLAYQADELRKNPHDLATRVRFGTTYFLWIEGVLALSVMKVTLGFCRRTGLLPGYYAGFTATCRDEARHVQAGMRFLRDQITSDPAMLKQVHSTLRTILWLATAASRNFAYEPLGWSAEDVQALMIGQLRTKLTSIGLDVPFELEILLTRIQPELAGG